MLASSVMQRDTFLSARLLYHDDVLATIVAIEGVHCLVLHLRAFLSTEEQYLVLAEHFGYLLSRHAVVQCLLPPQQVGILLSEVLHSLYSLLLLFAWFH